MKNKKAEKLFSIWWFFVLAFIAGGIVIGTLAYSSAEINVNEIESNILHDKLFECIVEDGYLIDLNNFDIFKECNLDKNIFGKGSDFYFNVSVYGKDNLIYSFTEGDFSFEKDCQISGEKNIKAKYFPNTSIIEARLGCRASLAWRSI